MLHAEPMCDNRSHNCLSLGDRLIGGKPAQCWVNEHGELGAALVKSVGSYIQCGKGASNGHMFRLEVATTVLAHPRFDHETSRAIATLARKPGGRRQLRLMRSRLPDGARLGELLQPYCEPPQAAPSRRRHATRLDVALPDELATSLELYSQQSKRLGDRKRERGHRYTEYTTGRRVMDATHFCAFVADRGIQHWAGVSQSLFDRYVTATSPKQGTRVFPFLRFVRQRYRLAGRLVRPRIKKTPALKRVMPVSEMPRVIRQISSIPDDELRLIGLLLAVYAQPISHSATLTASRFRQRNERMEALFARDWMPLDRVTGKLVLDLQPGLAKPVVASDFRVFRWKPQTYHSLFHQAAAIDAKAVRLGAIAAILRSGTTDRASICGLLGVSMVTVEYVERVFEWDLQQTVDPEIVAMRNRVIRGEAGG